MHHRILSACLALFLVLGLAAGARADKLICITDETLKGDQTVGSCLAKGEKFAIMDEKGVVRILSPQEIEITKRLNPKILEQPAFGVKLHHLAPEIPPLPVPPQVPK